MKHAPIKMIASDMDGTLLDSLSRVPERNKAAVAEAVRRGVIFVVSTGRMYHSARGFAEELGVAQFPLVCYNGSMIAKPDGEEFFHLKLDMDVALGLLAFFRDRNMYVQSYIDDRLYVKEDDAEQYRYYNKYFGVTGTAVGDALYAPARRPTKLLSKTEGIEDSRRLIGELSGMFPGRLYVTSSNEDFIEMMNPEANKAKCLRVLSESYGVPLENIMALGDGDNDAEMVGTAGLGIAVANARESVKKAARLVAPSNDECGVAWAIEEYVLK
ncbi:MAG: Cof-type HAD-IIB family hydrolase [Synergistaceae bacterium]|nr:Cof-type HAD-IIB family hydrolase [Synergistaceae bacterium]